MKEANVQLGQIVLSRQGRDKGTHFIVYKIVDSENVLIVDGKIRKLSKPKKKKIKHLEVKPQVITKLAEKISKQKPIFDSEVKSGLKLFEISIGEEE